MMATAECCWMLHWPILATSWESTAITGITVSSRYELLETGINNTTVGMSTAK